MTNHIDALEKQQYQALGRGEKKYLCHNTKTLYSWIQIVSIIINTLNLILKNYVF